MKHSAAKRLSALALAAALLLTLGACGEGSGGGSSGQSQESASGGGDWPVRVRDVDIPEAPERVLWAFALLGGGVGGFLGMRCFRHKTRHWYFRYGFPLLAVLDLAGLVWLLPLWNGL